MIDTWNYGDDEWRKTDECCLKLRFIDLETGQLQRAECGRFLSKRGVRSKRRGRIVLYDKRQVEAALEQRGAA